MIEYPPGYVTDRRPPTQEEIRAAVKVLVLRRLLIGLIVLAIIVFGSLMSVGVLLIRTTQTHNSPLLADTHTAAMAAQRGTDRIIDCTTPGGKCYNQSLKRQAKAVGVLNKATALTATLAASCAVNVAPGSFQSVYQKIYDCVQRGLRQRVSPAGR